MKLLKNLGMQYPTSISKRKYEYGLFECPNCLNSFKTQIRAINKKPTTNCASCAATINLTTHGKTGTRLYRIWINMKNRCNDSPNKHKSHKKYVDLGITVCFDWINSYEQFEEWALKNGYKDTLSIDRIEGSKGYYPSNCRWATDSLQAQNQLKINSTNTSGYRGVGRNKNRKKFGVQIRVNNKRIWLGSFEDALEGAKAYDQYIIDNNLAHTKNNVL